MDIEIIGCVAALILAFAMWRWSQRMELPPVANPELRALYEWENLPDSEKTIERAEDHLREHPDDLSRRIGILMRLGYGDNHDSTKLRHHTLELIKRLPHSMDIVAANHGECFRHPGYRDELVVALSAQLGQGFKDAGIHTNLGDIFGHAALPITEPERFCEWNELPPDTPLPEKLDEEKLDRAILHYEAAAKLSDDSIPAERLAQLLSNANRLDAAIPAFEKAMEMIPEQSRASVLVDYGECLAKAKRTKEAIAMLEQVRDCDTEGFENGPGCHTMEAETLLGHLALERKDQRGAVKHLLASTDVQGCCHNTTRGFPMSLARELMDREPKAVAEFCQTVLDDFTPQHEGFRRMLKDVEKAA